jgi:sigma-B regulation protein RsbU (phosphoserine phosphatase)
MNLLWAKLFTTLLLAALLLAVASSGRPRGLGVWAVLVGVLLARDLGFLAFGRELIVPLAELCVLALYLLWVRVFTGLQAADVVYLAVNFLALVAGAASFSLGWLPLTPAALSLLLLADVVYLAILLGLVSPYNTEGAEILMETRFVVIAGLFLVQVIGLLYGYSAPLVHNLLLPGEGLIHFYVLLAYNRRLHAESRRAIQFYSTNLDSTFEFMQNLGSAITAKIDLPRVLEIIIASAVHNIGADAGAILMVDEYEDVLKVRATRGIYPPLAPVPELARVNTAALKRHFADTPIRIGETLLGEVVKNGVPLLVRDAREDPRLAANRQDDIQFVSSLIAVPLVVSKRVLGVISTLKRAENRYFQDSDFQHLKTFAEYASITIDNLYTYLEVLEKRQMEREVDIAAEIQQKLLPSELPQLSGGSLAVHSRPARGVSGDYYDVLPLDQDKVALLVCDVAGKGIPAAMVMIMIRSITHLLVSPRLEASAILTGINRGITGRIDVDHFATIGLCIYDQASRRAAYANAAHLPLLVWRGGSRKLLRVDAEGLPIGVEREGKYGQRRFDLEPGDILLFCTDGILEAMSPRGEQYGLKRLAAVVQAGSSLEAPGLVEAIRADLDRHTAGARQHDDQTLLVLRVQ